jgi:acetoin utilization deacetylase AcuC-like enzyme
VFAFASKLGVPIAVTMAGGYGRDIDLTVELHLQTIRLACRAWTERSESRRAVTSA